MPAGAALAPAAAAQLVAADGAVSRCIEGGATPGRPPDRGDRGGTGRRSRLRTVTVDGDELPRAHRAAARRRRVPDRPRSLGETRRRAVVAPAAARASSAAIGGGRGARRLALARRIVRPIERLRDTAEHIARTQDLTTPIPTRRRRGRQPRPQLHHDGRRARRRRGAQQQRLVTDASHELRTPLTSLRTNAELLAAPDELDAEQTTRSSRASSFEVQRAHRPRLRAGRAGRRRSGDDEAPQDGRARRARRRRRDTRARAGPGAPSAVDERGTTGASRGRTWSNARSPTWSTTRSSTADRRDRDRRHRAPPRGPRPRPGHRRRRPAARVRPLLPLGRSADRARLRSRAGDRQADRRAPRRHVWATNDPDGGAVVGFELPAAARRPSRATGLTSRRRNSGGNALAGAGGDDRCLTYRSA